MLKTSYHNHTVWSDGKSTLPEMIAAATAAGLDELGISDHFILHPAGSHDPPFSVWWDMNKNVFDSTHPQDDVSFSKLLHAYVHQFDRFDHQSSAPLTIRRGLEADFFPETFDALRSLLNEEHSGGISLGNRLDYVIGSVHYVRAPAKSAFPAGYFNVDDKPELWESLGSTDPERREVWNEIGRLYWVAVRELAERGRGVYDIVGHIDLIKKFGKKYLPTTDVSLEIASAFDAIKSSGLAIELNTAGWRKTVAEQYPSEDLIREAFKREIPMLVNSDAHHSSEVASRFEDAYRLLWNAGYRSVLRYEHHEPISVSLEIAR